MFFGKLMFEIKFHAFRYYFKYKYSCFISLRGNKTFISLFSMNFGKGDRENVSNKLNFIKH